MIKQIKNNYLIKNTIILITTSIIIKILSLLNRILITRLLGTNGISLYVIILPTIMLLISLSSFSLNITVSKIISSNEKTNKNSEKEILKKAIIIGLYATIITLIVFVLLIKYICINLLNQKLAYTPLYASITIIPFSMLNSVYRGYFNGKNKINKSSISILLEQISRMILTLFIFYIILKINNKKSIVTLVTITIFSMSFGEIISLIYNVINAKRILKINKQNYSNPINNKLFNDIMSLSLSQTLTHLVSNITYFLEPIIYTHALKINNYANNEIMYRYSEVNAYALPLLTMFTFISHSIGTIILPTLSKNKDINKINSLSSYAIKLIFIPSIYVSIILYFYCDKFMYLLYNTTNGSMYVKRYTLIFMFFYLIPIFNNILIALGKEKKLLIISIASNIIKIIFIFILSFINIINHNSLFLSIIISNLITLITLYINIKKEINIKPNYKILFTYSLLFISLFLSIYILKYLNINYFLVCIISGLLYLFLIKISKVISFNNK